MFENFFFFSSVRATFFSHFEYALQYGKVVFEKGEREREALEGKVKVANNRWGEGTVIIKGEGGGGTVLRRPDGACLSSLFSAAFAADAAVFLLLGLMNNSGRIFMCALCADDKAEAQTTQLRKMRRGLTETLSYGGGGLGKRKITRN